MAHHHTTPHSPQCAPLFCGDDIGGGHAGFSEHGSVFSPLSTPRLGLMSHGLGSPFRLTPLHHSGHHSPFSFVCSPLSERPLSARCGGRGRAGTGPP